jgi:hypothetical protein
MSLRKDWSTIKGGAELLFKKGTAKAMIAALSKHEEPPAYPLKFKEDLGPTLDKYEAAKKPEDKKKFGDAAKVVIKSYKQAIAREKATLDSADKNIVVVLVKTLNEIEAEIT